METTQFSACRGGVDLSASEEEQVVKGTAVSSTCQELMRRELLHWEQGLSEAPKPQRPLAGHRAGLRLGVSPLRQGCGSPGFSEAGTGPVPPRQKVSSSILECVLFKRIKTVWPLTPCHFLPFIC